MSFHMTYLHAAPDARDLLCSVYARMQAEKTADIVFYDGTVRDAEGFATDLLRPGSLPFMVHDGITPVGCAWFNSIEGRSCRGHFVLFRAFWGRQTAAAIGRSIFASILTYQDAGGYLFDVIIGVVPVRNVLAWRLAEQCGAVRVGVVPHAAYMAHINHTEDVMLLVTTRETLGGL